MTRGKDIRCLKHGTVGVGALTVSHVVNDLYQGAVPVIIFFLATERDYSYVAATGITLAATFLSSVIQPLFGVFADRRRLTWMVGGGTLTAGVGIGLSGLFESYLLVWLAIALSGVGVAAYHPEAARSVRLAAGSSARSMSWFALGGNLGFALAPIVITPILLATGLLGTPLVAIPAIAMAAVMLPMLPRLIPTSQASASRRGNGDDAVKDDWRAFGWLTGIVVCRSILFFSSVTFLALYFTRELHQQTGVGSAALATFLAAGVAGTLGGGWLADRYGRVRAVRVGYILALPALGGLILAPNLAVAFAAVAILGVSLYLPFAVHTTLGQEYLPNRVGTASGVTLGVSVAVGGSFAPLLGWLADNQGLPLTFATLLVLPVCALLFSLRLPETGSRDISGSPSVSTTDDDHQASSSTEPSPHGGGRY